MDFIYSVFSFFLAKDLPPLRAPERHAPRNGASKEVKTLEEALRLCGAHDGMTISFHHHLRGGDGVLVPTIMTLRKMGIRGINLAPSSLHDGQKQLIECFKDGTVTNIQTGANDSLGLSAIFRFRLQDKNSF